MSVTAILLLVVLCGGIFFYFKVRTWIRQASQILFGTQDFMKGMQEREEMTRTTPKTVTGVTNFKLPQIEKDFPEFHWLEWKKHCEEQLVEYLNSLELGSLRPLRDCSETVKDELREQIGDRKNRGIVERFDNIVIHSTEITDYKKSSGLVSIRMQTGLEYVHTVNGEHPVNHMKEQHRFYMELFYVQDPDKAGVYTSRNAICKSCGAPITNLGAKHCEYCGSAVEVINIRVWTLGSIQMRD